MTLISVCDEVILPQRKLNPRPRPLLTYRLECEDVGLGVCMVGWQEAGSTRPYLAPRWARWGSLCPPGQRAPSHLAGRGPGHRQGDSVVVEMVPVSSCNHITLLKPLMTNLLEYKREAVLGIQLFPGAGDSTLHTGLPLEAGRSQMPCNSSLGQDASLTFMLFKIPFLPSPPDL